MKRQIVMLVAAFGLGAVIGVLVTERIPSPSTRVLTCPDTLQCPPDSDRVVLGVWSDGTTRLSTYDQSRGWMVHLGRSRASTTEHVVSWTDLPVIEASR